MEEYINDDRIGAQLSNDTINRKGQRNGISYDIEIMQKYTKW